MNCPNCQHEIQTDAQYCSHCGMKIERCPHCQQPLMPNAKFCRYCGQPVQSASSYHEEIGGYYVPIQDHEYANTSKETTAFHDVLPKQKVNKKIVILSVVALLIATIVSFWYLRNTPPITLSQNNQSKDSESFQIQTSQDTLAKIGNSNQGGHVAIYKNKIYVVNEQGQLVLMDQSATSLNVIIDDQVEYVNIVNDTIYYTNKDHHICSSDLNGKNQQVIVQTKAYYMMVVDQKIYYQSDSDGEKIYVYDLIKHHNTKLNNRHSYNINVIDDKIYYTSTDGIYCMGIDGKGDEKLVDGTCHQVIYKDHQLYYTKDSRQVMCYDIKSKTIQMIKDQALLMNMNQDYLFYYSSEGLNRYDLKTQKSTVIYQNNIQYCEILGDKLVLTIQDIQNQQYRLIMDFNGQQEQRLFKSQNGDFI